MTDGQAFFGGLWSEVHGLMTGGHHRMPVILSTDDARRGIEPGPLPADLLVP